MVLQVVIISILAAGVAAQVQVRLDQGVATGRVDNTPMGDVTKFLGLPYAGAPVGKKRFQPPTTHQGWGVSDYDASYFRPNCPQKKEMLQHFYGLDQNEIEKMEFSEDCLYLNVFIPGKGVDENAALPVMIWFHGGDFKYSSGQIVGTTSKESPEALVISGNVIVVTFNYRLGAFGFLTLGGKQSSPNNAILDQLKAMTWVQKNIEKFGGNPRQVTIFGDEMGGFSVQMHLYIEKSLGLFNRAAISSGAYTANQIPTEWKAAYQWYDFAEQFGCGSLKHNKTEVMMCLQEKPVDELVNKLPRNPPGVVIDDMLLKDQPENLLKKKQFNSVELIVGCNIWDGDFFLFGRPYARSVYERGMPMQMTETIMNMLSFVGYPKANTDIGRHLHDIFSALYFTNLTNPHQTLKDAIHILRDGFFWSQAVKLAYANMLVGKNTYVYFFEKSSPAADSRHAGSIVNGPGSGDEVAYIMGDVNANPGEERHFMDSMMKAWSTFADTGKPQFLDTTNTPIDWPPFDLKTTRIGWTSPMTKENIINFPPRGALYFNLLFRPLVEFLESKEKMKGNHGMNKREWGRHEMAWPEMGKPEMDRTERGRSEKGCPDKGKPEMRKPEMGWPEIGKHEIGRPEKGWAKMGRPEMDRPEIGKHEMGRPEKDWPKMERPEMGKHETGRPDKDSSKMGRHEKGSPEMGSQEVGSSEMRTSEMGKPGMGRPEHQNSDTEWSWKSPVAEKRTQLESSTGSMGITTYIMLGCVVLLVLLMIIVFVVMCNMYKQMRKPPTPQKF